MKAIAFLLLPLLTTGQTMYKGSIVNKRTKEKVPFVTVGLGIENIGANANENGQFAISSIKNNAADTLYLSCIGYERLKIPVAQLSAEVIEMEEKETPLKEVIVAAKKWDYITLNENDGFGNVSQTTNGSTSQIAKYFHINHSPAYLKEVKIGKANYPLENHKTIFRLSIYDMDTFSKAPSTSLCEELIEVKTKKKNTIIDLEKYKIRIPKNDFFVAVEWLKIPYNEKRGIVEQNGTKKERLTYSPYIKIAHHSGKFEPTIWGKAHEVWFLDYRNKWNPLFHVDNVSIAATIKY